MPLFHMSPSSALPLTSEYSARSTAFARWRPSRDRFVASPILQTSPLPTTFPGVLPSPPSHVSPKPASPTLRPASTKMQISALLRQVHFTTRYSLSITDSQRMPLPRLHAAGIEDSRGFPLLYDNERPRKSNKSRSPGALYPADLSRTMRSKRTTSPYVSTLRP